MFKFIKYALTVGILSGGATATLAADLPSEILNDVMQVCRPDYHNVCSYVLPGDGRVGRCLLDHERDLSPSCLKAVKFAYAVEVCMPDYQRYCNGVTGGAGPVVQCLSDRVGSLSHECERVVSANAPYFDGHERRYGDYHGGQSYGEGRYAESDRHYYKDHSEDEDRYDDHDGYDDGPAYREDRYADRGYSDRHYDSERHDGGYEDREPIK